MDADRPKAIAALSDHLQPWIVDLCRVQDFAAGQPDALEGPEPFAQYVSDMLVREVFGKIEIPDARQRIMTIRRIC